jgi:hypothetical protein
MKKVGEHLRTTSLLTAALSAAVVLALPAAAGAQFMDPVLEQYAPSTEQIDKKVKEGSGGQGGDGQSEGDDSVEEGAPVGAAGQGDDVEADNGGGGGGSAGGSAGGGDGAGGAGAARGTDGDGSPSGAQSSGLDARLLSGVPVTWFDFVALALATIVLAGTAVMLRRVSRSPRVEG